MKLYKRAYPSVLQAPWQGKCSSSQKGSSTPSSELDPPWSHGVRDLGAARAHAHCSRDRYPLSGRVPRDPLKNTCYRRGAVCVLHKSSDRYSLCVRDYVAH